MPIDWSLLERRTAGYTDAQIAAAVKKAKALKGKAGAPDKIPTFWKQPKAMPTIADVDFGTVSVETVDIENLLASNKFLKRARLIWHIENVPKAINPSPFTEHPLLGEYDEGTVIIDGHHRIAALMLLGATTSQAYVLPAT